MQDDSSVADLGCLSRILIFSHPGSENKKNAEEGIETCCPNYFTAINFTKLKIILFLNRCLKKLKPIDTGFKYFLPKKLLLSTQKYGSRIRNPRSGQKTNPGSATLNESTGTTEIQVNKLI
jgi:hypothetical protein